MTKPLTERQKARNVRNKARTKILGAANQVRHDHSGDRTPRYSRRRLNEAVAVVRRRRLVSAKVLAAAGFNAEGSK